MHRSRRQHAATRRSTVAANLVLANLSGHDSHGVGMVPRYVDAVLEGGLKPNTGDQGQARRRQPAGARRPARLRPDRRRAGDGAGHRTRAGRHGSCIMALAQRAPPGPHRPLRRDGGGAGPGRRSTSSTCCRGPWSRPGAAATGASAPTRAASACRWRAASPSCSTSRPAAWRRARCAWPTTRAAQVEPGYLIDEHGAADRPTPAWWWCRNRTACSARCMTFGEHKGYGMAVACELLGGALTGGGTWHRPADTARAVLNGMLTIADRPGEAGHAGGLRARGAGLRRLAAAEPAGAGSDGVLLAGEPEREARREREASGIVIDEQTWREIVAAGAKVGAARIGGDPRGVTRSTRVSRVTPARRGPRAFKRCVRSTRSTPWGSRPSRE